MKREPIMILGIVQAIIAFLSAVGALKGTPTAQDYAQAAAGGLAVLAASAYGRTLVSPSSKA